MASTASDSTTRREPATTTQLVALPRRTEWSVVQERPAEDADLDVFTRQSGNNDWIDLGTLGALNLGVVARVELSFGSYATPEYRAIILGTDERTLRVYGPTVVILQDQLLRRTTQHDNTPPAMRVTPSGDTTSVKPPPSLDNERLHHRRWLRSLGRQLSRMLFDQ